MLLTGDAPVRDRFVSAGGIVVPIAFRTGASATRDEIAAAIRLHMAAIRERVPGAQGMGVDPRTGELVLLVAPGTDRARADAVRSEVAALTGVPVRVSAANRATADFAAAGDEDGDGGLGGGSRVSGPDPRDGRRYVCTAGFVVTDEVRTGVVTAAHCPDELFYQDPVDGEIALGFVGQWGVGHQDVQVNVSERARQPLFYADTAKTAARPLTGARALAGTRAGDAVCHRGETSGYGCALVELVDFSPPGDLCAGPCDPVWVTVAGPQCRHGDSGGPVFVGTTAFGITKGGNYGSEGRCSFYFYMSTDYLPTGWRLLRAPAGTEESASAVGTRSR